MDRQDRPRRCGWAPVAKTRSTRSRSRVTLTGWRSRRTTIATVRRCVRASRCSTPSAPRTRRSCGRSPSTAARCTSAAGGAARRLGTSWPARTAYPSPWRSWRSATSTTGTSAGPGSPCTPTTAAGGSARRLATHLMDLSRELGCTKFGGAGWDLPATESFATSVGCTLAAVEVFRMVRPQRPARRAHRAGVRRGGRCARGLRARPDRRPHSRGPARRGVGADRGDQRRADRRPRGRGRALPAGAGARLRAGGRRRRPPALPDPRPAPRDRRAGRAHRGAGRRGRARSAAASTTPPSSAPTGATGSACCSRPT